MDPKFPLGSRCGVNSSSKSDAALINNYLRSLSKTKTHQKSSVLHLSSHSFSADFEAANNVFDIIRSRTGHIPNARLHCFLTDVHTHKLTATIPVYPAKFTKQSPNAISCFSTVVMCACDVIVRDATVILANGHLEIHNVFVHVIHTIVRHRDYTN